LAPQQTNSPNRREDENARWTEKECQGEAWQDQQERALFGTRRMDFPRADKRVESEIVNPACQHNFGLGKEFHDTFKGAESAVCAGSQCQHDAAVSDG
jgi:hypothetical protein